MPLAYITIPLVNYLFLSVTGTVTMSGVFVDANGNQVGNSFTGSVAAGSGSQAGVSLATVSGAAVPSGAIAALVVISAAVYYCVGGSQVAIATDFEANYANYPQYAASKQIRLGADVL